MITWLLDTGPLVAYLDAKDPSHAESAAALDEFAGMLCTTSAVITEAMHFVAPRANGPELLSKFVDASGMHVYDLSQPAALLEAAVLMRKYVDTPMDYADATLVLLAEHLNVSYVATLDRRGFSTFRTRDSRALVKVLDVQ